MYSNKGFSLIELMIVVGIIGILSLLALPEYKKYVDRVKMIEIVSHISNKMRQAQISYSTDDYSFYHQSWMLPNISGASKQPYCYQSIGGYGMGSLQASSRSKGAISKAFQALGLSSGATELMESFFQSNDEYGYVSMSYAMYDNCNGTNAGLGSAPVPLFAINLMNSYGASLTIQIETIYVPHAGTQGTDRRYGIIEYYDSEGKNTRTVNASVNPTIVCHLRQYGDPSSYGEQLSRFMQVIPSVCKWVSINKSGDKERRFQSLL